MLDDDSAVIPGLRRLVTLRHDGDEFIPIEFVGFDSELDGVPTPNSRYHLWECRCAGGAPRYDRTVSEAGPAGMPGATR